MRIHPSIASCNLINVERELSRIESWPNLHFDIEDGNFVPNITFGLKFIKAAREKSSADFDAHLMVNGDRTRRARRKIPARNN
ncbi:MAG: hypothetical protein ACTTJZ_01015 [Sphaerochaetaceae bacterium]